MKITARQLKTADTLDGAGVVAATTNRLTGRTHVELISSAGVRSTRDLGANTVLIVDRAEVDGTDPLARPYWWGLEREMERAEDERAYAPQAGHSTPCVCGPYDRCWEQRVEAARRVAHRGAGAVHRELHRAYND